MLTTTLIFDPKTLARWKAEGISDVIVSFEKKGCEGNEIAVTPGKPIESQNSKTQFQSRTIPLESRTSQSADLTNSDLTTHETTITTHTLPQDSDLTIHALPEDWEKLENSRITFANGKWIFTSDQVKRRCGCGSSFSFSDENILLRDFPQIPTLPSAVSFELLENLSSKSLSQNTHILIDFGTKETEEIHIQSGANVLYRGFFPTGNHSIIRFILEEGAKLDARFLVFASKGHAKFDLETTLQGSRANAEIVYRAFAFEDAEIQANTHLDIRAWLEEIRGNIEWKNIFFADQAKISGTPRISAASDKISAGHSLSFEKISELDEFFLQSRGIPPRVARRMLAEAHIQRIFSGLPEEFSAVEEYLRKAAMSKLE